MRCIPCHHSIPVTTVQYSTVQYSMHACVHAQTHNHFTALWTLSGTTKVSWYQKKHSPTHTYHGHQPSLICFLHLLRSMAVQQIHKNQTTIKPRWNMHAKMMGTLPVFQFQTQWCNWCKTLTSDVPWMHSVFSVASTERMGSQQLCHTTVVSAPCMSYHPSTIDRATYDNNLSIANTIHCVSVSPKALIVSQPTVSSEWHRTFTYLPSTAAYTLSREMMCYVFLISWPMDGMCMPIIKHVQF